MELMRNVWLSRCRTGRALRLLEPTRFLRRSSVITVPIDLPPFRCEESVGDGRRSLSCSTRSNTVAMLPPTKWAWVDSNYRPHAYQASIPGP